MWNSNSDNKKTRDVSLVETTNDQNKSPAGQPPSNIAAGNLPCNGKPSKVTAVATTKNDSGSGGVDSGFISGPQLVEDYDDLDVGGAGRGDGGGSSATIPSVQLNIVHHKQQHLAYDYQDSGCIEEDLIDGEEEHHRKQMPLITTIAASPEAQQRELLVDNNDEDDKDQIILDSGIDAGITEWFCKLSLKDPLQQVNNLGPASERTTHANSGNKDTGDTPSWKKYYQQNNDGDTLLHLACITGHVGAVAALIRMAPHPCFFNIQNDKIQTALHLAVIYGQPKILRMLLIAGAEPTVRDRNGNTALHLASMSGDTQCVKVLTISISASEINEAHLSSDKTTSYLDCAHLPAELEIRNYDGERCVHLAAQGGHIDILRHLVCLGADINAREGKAGRTPLHIAIECCNEVLANFIIEECSELYLETATYAGLTAYQFACILYNSTMQNNLEKSGAEPLTPPDSDSSDLDD